MRSSPHVVAPLLASTALGLLSGCRGQSHCVSDSTHQVVDASFCRESAGTPVTKGTYHLEDTGTERGGFGNSFAAIVIGAGVAILIIRPGG